MKQFQNAQYSTTLSVEIDSAIFSKLKNSAVPHPHQGYQHMWPTVISGCACLPAASRFQGVMKELRLTGKGSNETDASAIHVDTRKVKPSPCGYVRTAQIRRAVLW